MPERGGARENGRDDFRLFRGGCEAVGSSAGAPTCAAAGPRCPFGGGRVGWCVFELDEPRAAQIWSGGVFSCVRAASQLSSGRPSGGTLIPPSPQHGFPNCCVLPDVNAPTYTGTRAPFQIPSAPTDRRACGLSFTSCPARLSSLDLRINLSTSGSLPVGLHYGFYFGSGSWWRRSTTAPGTIDRRDLSLRACSFRLQRQRILPGPSPGTCKRLASFPLLQPHHLLDRPLRIGLPGRQLDCSVHPST